ncbi:MAG: glycosyltransferase, partial [Candidatus Krumholzibacteria bacterium]|nr:glycosyltransferase [Candidatus Krumholzibacteria bacterium]
VIRGQDIVYVANDWRAENKTSAHHVAEVLARGNRILYIEAAGQRAPRASGRDLRRVVRKIAGALKRPRPVAEGVWVYSPLILPFHRFGAARHLNRLLLRSLLRLAVRRVGFERPLLWIVLPHYYSVVDDLPSCGVVYYCVDEYASQPDVDGDAIRRMEAHVLRRADVAFAVSAPLVAAKQQLNANTYASPHGVDVSHFRRAMEPGAVPGDVRDIPRPIAGFFGLIEEWIDLELMETAARALPGVSFVLIGRSARPLGRLTALPNVYVLGQRPYAQLPDYLRTFDVGLLPYHLNTQVMNSNPKKLREYLAGGKPVVSVRVPEVERYSRLVRIADGPEQFTAAIAEAIAETGPERSRERAAAMEAESWEQRVANVSDIVVRHIPAVRHD